jgi:hypothetical protein
MPGHGERPEHTRDLAILALLEQPTQARAAEAAGIGLTTLKAWLAEPEFQAAYRQARRQLVEVALGRLQQAMGEAVEALRRNLTAGKAGDQVRAALGILEHATRAVQTADLLALVEDLKRQVEARQREHGDHGDPLAGGPEAASGIGPDGAGPDAAAPAAAGGLEPHPDVLREIPRPLADGPPPPLF